MLVTGMFMSVLDISIVNVALGAFEAGLLQPQALVPSTRRTGT